MWRAILLCLLLGAGCSGGEPSVSPSPAQTPVSTEPVEAPVAVVARRVSPGEAIKIRSAELAQLKTQLGRLPELTRELATLSAQHRQLLADSGNRHSDSEHSELVEEGAATVDVASGALFEPEALDYSQYPEKTLLELAKLDQQVDQARAVLPILSQRERQVLWLRKDIERLGAMPLN